MRFIFHSLLTGCWSPPSTMCWPFGIGDGSGGGGPPLRFYPHSSNAYPSNSYALNPYAPNPYAPNPYRPSPYHIPPSAFNSPPPMVDLVTPLSTCLKCNSPSPSGPPRLRSHPTTNHPQQRAHAPHPRMYVRPFI